MSYIFIQGRRKDKIALVKSSPVNFRYVYTFPNQDTRHGPKQRILKTGGDKANKTVFPGGPSALASGTDWVPTPALLGRSLLQVWTKV